MLKDDFIADSTRIMREAARMLDAVMDQRDRAIELCKQLRRERDEMAVIARDAIAVAEAYKDEALRLSAKPSSPLLLN